MDVQLYFFVGMEEISTKANYFGYDFELDEPKFQSNGLTVDNRDIWLWCERYDLFYKTNLIDLQKECEDKEKKINNKK